MLYFTSGVCAGGKDKDQRFVVTGVLENRIQVEKRGLNEAFVQLVSDHMLQ